jgi:uncharacterized cupredoxin-like copper-binding protein
MRSLRSIAAVASTAALIGMMTLSGSGAWAQDATPEAVETTPPRPVHIHAGSCPGIGEVVAPLTDLTGGTGERMGQARRAFAAESSYTNVPMTLDAILGADHAINVHLSAEQIDTYIACGDLGGMLTAGGSMIVGLGEENDSGYTGIAFLAPGADGASTDVSVFIAPTLSGRDRGAAEGETEEAATLPAADETPAAEESADMAGTPAAEHDMSAMGTPSAAAEGTDETMMAGEQVPVSLMEFMITMPSTLTAGPVTFAVTNDGTITHSFEVESDEAGIEEELETPLAPGETGMLTVDLAPGTYEIYCPIGNHADQGMMLEVTVA